MKHAQLKTHTEAREWFTNHGVSIAEWCRERGFGVSLTRQILLGKNPCTRGQSHLIAIALGMKHGVATKTPEEARQRGPHSNRRAAAQPQL